MIRQCFKRCDFITSICIWLKLFGAALKNVASLVLYVYCLLWLNICNIDGLSLTGDLGDIKGQRSHVYSFSGCLLSTLGVPVPC